MPRPLPSATTSTRAAACVLAALSALGTAPALRAAEPAPASPATKARVLEPAYSPLPVGWLARAHAAVSRLQGSSRSDADFADEEAAFRASFLTGHLFAAPRPLTSLLSFEVDAAPSPAAGAPIMAAEAEATPAANPLPANFAAGQSFSHPLATAPAATEPGADVPGIGSASPFAPASGFTTERRDLAADFRQADALTPANSGPLFASSASLVLSLAGGPTPAAAHAVPPVPLATTTSGTLTPTATTYNYSTAPWNIASGTGNYPDGGGAATLNSPVGATPGTVAAGTTLTVDVSPQLSQITYNSPFSYAFAAGTSTSIVADPTNGLTLNAVLTATNSPTTLFTTFNPVNSPISGGGTAGVIKTGNGTVTLGGTNTFTGGVHINGGILVTTGSGGDAVFGATGTGNDIFINGGTLFTGSTGGLTTARNVILGASGGTIQTSTAFTVNGVVSGSGPLLINGFGGVQLTLTAANTYTGATSNSLSTAGYLTLSGNGSIANSSSYDFAGFVTLDNSGTTGVNRLGDNAAVAARGLFLNLTGNGSAATAETIGALTLSNGVTTLNVTPGTAGASLTASGVTRQNGSTLVVRGANLGAAPGVGNGNVYSTAAPALVGGGGAVNSTTQSIVPWALGNLTNPASSTTGNTAANMVGSSLVTYTAANGFRPLATTEYATALGGNSTDNVRLTAAATAAASTANALVFAPGAAATLSGGPITLTSGAFVYSPTADVTGTVSAGLNFGAAEGVIQYTSALGLSGAVTGSGGLTLMSPTNSTLTLTGANTYTGTTTIVAGQVAYSGTVANDGVTAGPFGLDTSAIVLNPGTGYAFLNATGTTTFNRNLTVVGANAPGLAYFGSTSGAGTVTMNGNIALQRSLVVVGGNSTTPVIFNGVISGSGGLTGFGAGYYDTINGNNTFTGGVNARGDTFTLGSDTAFGNGGTVYVSAASTFQGSGTAARTISNPWVTLATPTFTGTAPLTLSGAFNLNGARTVTVSNTALTSFNGVVSNGALTKGGTGAVAFNSPTGNTFTGGFVNTGTTTTVSAIYANNTSGSAFGTGAVSVGGNSATSFSTLAGSFLSSGAASIGGRLSPGNTPTALTPATAGVGVVGTANFGGALTFSSATTSSLYLDIAGAPGTTGSNDRVIVGGALTLAGTVNFATANGYTVQAGDKFDFLDWGTITAGTINYNFSNVTFASGVSFDTSNFLTDGTLTAVVPEPATVLGGLLTALLGFLGWRRRARA